MNIMVVSQMDLASPTGVTTYYVHLQHDFEKQGHTVHIVSLKDRPRFISFIFKAYWSIMKYLPKRMMKMWSVEWDSYLSQYLAVRKARNKAKWDIIHAQDPLSAAVANRVFKRKVPVVLTCHFNDHPVEEKILEYKLSERQVQKVTDWYRWIFSHTHNYIFVSRYCYEKSKFLLPASINMKVIPNGVQFTSTDQPHQRKNILEIVNVGTMEIRKNQVLLIEMARILSEKQFPFELKFYGHGEFLQQWEELVSKYALGSHVIFAGFQKGIKEKIAVADLYIHAALNENCSMSILEAFAVQLPVLALATGGTPELFPGADAGLLPANITAEELANDVIRRVTEHSLGSLQQEQYAFAAPRFTLLAMSRQTFQFYCELKAAVA